VRQGSLLRGAVTAPLQSRRRYLCYNAMHWMPVSWQKATISS
jgi:hypothetical protein